MATLSKLFVEQLKTKTCQSLPIHQGSCFMHFLRNVPLYFLSNFKFYIPVCLLPAVIKIHSMNKKKLRNTLEYYLECSLVGTTIGCIINANVCILRHFLGHFGLYSMVYFPTFIGAFVTYLCSPRALLVFYPTIYQCNIESFLLMRQFFVSRLISDSRLLQTYLFMLCSGVILQGKHLYNIKGFWLLESNPKVAEIGIREDNKCQLHPKITCRRYLLEGMRKYFILGLSLDIVKTLMSKVEVTADQSRLLAKIKNFRIRSLALLTTYMCIYRFTHCFLNRQFPNESASNQFTSACLAGFCYYLHPQSALLCYALVQAARTLWTIFKVENFNTKNKVLGYILRIPFDRIIFPFALANFVHIHCLKPEYGSRLATAICNGITNGYANHVKVQIEKMNEQVKEMAYLRKSM